MRSRLQFPMLAAVAAVATFVVSHLASSVPRAGGASERFPGVAAGSGNPVSAAVHDEALEDGPSTPFAHRTVEQDAALVPQTAGEALEPVGSTTSAFSAPEAYRSPEEYCADPSVNVGARRLTLEQHAELERLVAWLDLRLKDKAREALVAASDAVSWKIELGFGEVGGDAQEHDPARGGRMIVSRSTADGRSYRVSLNAGEFAYVDTAYADARVEASWGKDRIREFFRSLP